MSGSIRSRMIASGASLRASAIPPRPSPAAITRNPSNSSASRSPSTMCGSSSTTRTVFFAGAMACSRLYTANRRGAGVGSRGGRERGPQGPHVPARDPRHREQRRVVGGADRREIADMREERLLGLAAQPFDVVERRREAPLLPDAHPSSVREPVRLVAKPREQEERRRAAPQRDRVLLTGQVDPIQQLLLLLPSRP